MRKNCLECSTPIIGRVDKKYCCNYCRSSANNKRNKTRNSSILKVNKVLKRNREILKGLYAKNQLEIEQEHLLLKGFVFNFFTGQKIIHQLKVNFCYDYAWANSKNGKVNIIKLGSSADLKRLNKINQVI